MRRRSRRTDIGRPGFQPYAGSYASGTMAPRGPSGCWAMTHASPTRRQGSQFAFGATSPRTTTAVPDAVRNGSAPTGRSSSTTASSASHAGTGLWRRRDGSSGTGMIDFPANSGVAAAASAPVKPTRRSCSPSGVSSASTRPCRPSGSIQVIGPSGSRTTSSGTIASAARPLSCNVVVTAPLAERVSSPAFSRRTTTRTGM